MIHIVCANCFPKKSEENPKSFHRLASEELYLLKGLVLLSQYKVVGPDCGAEGGAEQSESDANSLSN